MVFLVSLFLFGFVFLGSNGKNVKIPSYVNLCKRHDPNLDKCVTNTIHELMPYLAKGIPEFDIPPMDPLGITTISVHTGTGGNMNLEIELSDGVLYGLSKTIITDFDIDLDKALFNCTMITPEMRILGKYKIKGKVLLFVVDDKGGVDLNATDLKQTVRWHGDFFTKNNMQYIKFNKIKSKNSMANMKIRFDSDILNGGNKDLIETINKAVNDNAAILKEELDPLIEEVIEEMHLDIFNRAFALHPVDVLFPRD